VSRLAISIKLPVTLRCLIRAVQNRPFEKRMLSGHGDLTLAHRM
jgi:hypothetical protein